MTTTTTSTEPPTLGPLARLARGFGAFRRSIFWGAMRRQKGFLWLTVLLAFAGFAYQIIQNGVVASVVDLVAPTSDAARDRIAQLDQREVLGSRVTTLVVLAFVGLAIGGATRAVSARISYKLEFDLRNLVYLRLQRSDPRDLDRYDTGQVVTRAQSDLNLLELLVQFGLQILTGIPLILGYAVYLSFSNVPLTLLALSTFAINGYLANRVRHRLWGFSFLKLDQQAQITTAIDEPVRGIRVVKAFGREQEERSRVKTAALQAFRYAMALIRLQARYDLVLRAAPVFIRAALLLFGARAVVGGGMTLGEFLIFFQFTGTGVSIATEIDELVALWQYTKTGAGRLTELLRQDKGRAHSGIEELPETPSGFELRGVGVAFGDLTVLSDVDLRAEPGTVTVVHGPPGSGKSTLAEVCSGEILPSEGEVVLDGISLDRIDPQVLRRAIHVVPEEPFLFARTLRENLSVGALALSLDADATVPDESLMAALRAAAVEEIVDEVGGLDVPLGDRGMTLSGGQRQRLAVARALVETPRVLVLDDALSAVSPSLELTIVERIRAHGPAVAVVCITRRTSLESLADRVVVLPASGAQRELEPAIPYPADATSAEAALDAVAGAGVPYDARLIPILADLKIGEDMPPIDDDFADRDERPRMRSLLKAFKLPVLVATLFLILETAINLVPEYVFGEAADYIRDGNTAATDRLGLGLVAVAVGVGLATYGFRIWSVRATEGILFTMRRRLFGRLSRLGIDYYDRELPGYVSARVVSDLNQVERFLGGGTRERSGVYQLGATAARFALTVGIILFLSPPVAVLIIGFAVAVALLTMAQIPIADRVFHRTRLALGDVVARLQEDYAGRYVISGFGAERRARIDFGTAARRYRSAQRLSYAVSYGYIELMQFATSVATAFVYLRAGNLALSGAISAGTMLTLRLYINDAIGPIPRLGRVWQDWVKTRVALRQLSLPFDTPVLPVTAPTAVPAPQLEGAIRFENVAFGYPGTAREVIHDLSFEVGAGQVVAIVGYTGAGKSSIAKLLARIYDPTAGQVLVDGHDLRDLDLSSFRRRLGIVPQDAFVFKGTVASNIAYGRPEASREEIEEAARAVGAAAVLVGLDGGYDAVVEEEGRNLTAAQRQLIALARMWLVRPDIIVLDESTSSLDSETEATVLDAVLSLQRTTVLITHRQPVAERAHLALVLDAGRIVEAGRPRRLVRAEGPYARLWTAVAAKRPRRAGAVAVKAARSPGRRTRHGKP